MAELWLLYSHSYVIFLYVITIPYNYNSLAIKMYPYVY